MKQPKPKKGVESTTTPPAVQLRMTWEKEAGRPLTDAEFNRRMEAHLRRLRASVRKLEE